MKINIIFLLSVALFHNLGIGLVYPIFSSLLFSSNDLSAAFAEMSYSDRGGLLGLLLGTAPFTQCLVAPFVGKLSDRYGRKPLLLITLTIGVFGYAIGALALYWRVSLPWLLFSRVIVGISCSNSSVVNAALSDLVPATDRSRIFTWLGFAYGSGFTIGPFVGGFLNYPPYWFRNIFPCFDALNYSRPFMIAGSLLFIGVLFLYSTFTETARIKPKLESLQLETESFSLRTIVYPRVILFLIATFLFCFGWSFYWEMISAIWVHIEQIGTDEVGVRYAYGALCYTILGITVVQYLTTKIPDKILFMAGCTILGSSILSVNYIVEPRYFFWLIPIQQFGIALLYPSALANISRYANELHQGAIMGLHASMVSLGFALSPFSAWFFLRLSPYAPIYVGFWALFLSLCAFIAALRSSIRDVPSLEEAPAQIFVEEKME
ncbi:MAG: MFS transporter [Chlamydia sp.]